MIHTEEIENANSDEGGRKQPHTQYLSLMHWQDTLKAQENRQ